MIGSWRRQWALSPDIDDGVIGFAPNLRIECRVLQELRKDEERGSKILFEGLVSPSPMVVGWSLLGLLYWHSPYLNEIPSATLEREETIIWRLDRRGRKTTSLGEFARTVRDQYIHEMTRPRREERRFRPDYVLRKTRTK